MKIAIGSDHAGFELKELLKQELLSNNYEVIDVGTNSLDSVDYPLFGKKVGELVASKEAKYGVVVCGSGIGISIAANKVKGIRCANVFTNDHTILSRQHNDANVIGFGARFLNFEQAKEMLHLFLNTSFMEGRHTKRVNMLDE